MLERELCVRNALGLHARAAAKLVRLANTFRSSIALSRSDMERSANGKDILDILQLAAGCGINLSIIVDGPDEREAMGQITQLFADKFGEE